jgi:hypothetical protein
MPMDDVERWDTHCGRCQRRTPHWRGRIGYGPFGKPAGLWPLFALVELLFPWQCSACGALRWPWPWR